MAVSEDDVRHVAALARLGIDAARLPSLVSELNGILDHMEVLSAVGTGDGGRETGESADQTGDGGRGTRESVSPPAPTPLRADGGLSIPLLSPHESFAPEMRDGFFLVPRLETHEDQGERAP